MPLDELTTTVGAVALAAGAVALVALVLAVVVAVKARRLRAAQSTVLGGHERRDLVAHAERLENGFVELRDWVEDSLSGLDQRSIAQDARIAGCVAHRAVIRYDAYGEMSGQQSSSLALLDSHRSGVVISSISHRDQARIYVKQVHEGESEVQLSPEEHEAVTSALGSHPQGAPDTGVVRAHDARQSA
ncbi:MAG: DUF4446 family protein [Thermoleophilaceae bacterium]